MSGRKVEEDVILWNKFIDGDDRAFSSLYYTYAQEMYAYGINFSSDGELLKDFIQDIFVNLYNQRSTLQSVRPKFYLFKALKNRVMNHYRDSKEFSVLEENICFIASEISVEEDFIKKEGVALLNRQIVDMLNILTSRQKEAIYLRYIEELSIDQIADIMQMNYQSVQNLIQRSITKLRDVLKG